MKIEKLIDYFEAGTLSKEAWKHDTHLRVALWYILKEPDIWHALCKVKAGIIIRNNSVGIQNSGTKGYHETITVFWMKEVQELVLRYPDKSYADIIDILLNTPPFNGDHREYLQQAYSVETIKSAKARAVYIEPN
jgi:hypothetical protein